MPTTGKAVVIEPDGTARVIDWQYPPPAEGHLQLLYREIQCSLVEAVSLYPDGADVPGLVELTLWIDEEGKYNGGEFNPLATGVVGGLYGALFPGDYVAGPALFTGGVDDEGETQPLDEEALTLLTSVQLVEERSEGNE